MSGIQAPNVSCNLDKASRKPTRFPLVRLEALDNLWFQVSGTLCNIACEHCFISCSPTNHSFEFMTLEQVKGYLEESVRLGVKEYYFTGGEPFMNRQILDILELTLQYGPATVLTNGMLLRPRVVERLAEIEAQSIYSLEIRLSLDGYTEEMNDAIRGKGVFQKAMAGMKRLVEHGFLPIITVAKTWEDSEDEAVLEGFLNTLRAHGYQRPRIKILPSLRIGREAARSHGYEDYEYVSEEMMQGYDASNLICANSRIATSKGVYVCPILIEARDAWLGNTLSESAAVGYRLRHQACFTCYMFGSICSNFVSVGRNV
ncbi:MAG: radical SAM protein [Calditrichaeota bacterium]|nr:MAG: radical SAM protein [Calditrichota bacterium]